MKLHLTAITLSLMLVSAMSMPARGQNKPDIRKMHASVVTERLRYEREEKVYFRGMIVNNTQSVLCVPDAYFARYASHMRPMYEIRRKDGKAVKYVNRLDEFPFPMENFRILPPGHQMTHEVALSELYSLPEGEYDMRMILFVPYCESFKDGYFFPPFPGSYGWDNEGFKPGDEELFGKGLVFDSGIVDFTVKPGFERE